MGEQFRENKSKITFATIFTLIGMILGAIGAAFGAGSALGNYDSRLAAVEREVERISGSIEDLEAIRTNIEWLVRRGGGRPVQPGPEG